MSGCWQELIPAIHHAKRPAGAPAATSLNIANPMGLNQVATAHPTALLRDAEGRWARPTLQHCALAPLIAHYSSLITSYTPMMLYPAST